MLHQLTTAFHALPLFRMPHQIEPVTAELAAEPLCAKAYHRARSQG